MRENKFDFGPILKKNIREIMTVKGWELDDLIEEAYQKVGMSEDTTVNLYYGRSHDPHASTLAALSEVLGISMNCLIGRCQHTSDERVLLQHYRSCGNHGKSVIRLIARYEKDAAVSERNADGKHSIPCLVPNGNIYDGIVYDTCGTEDIWTDKEKAYTAIRMTENDLSPLYCKNDIILLEDRFPKNGEYAAFFRNGRAYIRRYIEEKDSNGKDFYCLRCLHNHGKDIILKRMDEVEYIGTIIDVVRA